MPSSARSKNRSAPHPAALRSAPHADPRLLRACPTRRSSDLASARGASRGHWNPCTRSWPAGTGSRRRPPCCGRPSSPRPPSRLRWMPRRGRGGRRSEEHTSELQSPCNLVCRLLLAAKTEVLRTLQHCAPHRTPTLASSAPALHDALPIWHQHAGLPGDVGTHVPGVGQRVQGRVAGLRVVVDPVVLGRLLGFDGCHAVVAEVGDRKSTRLNSSHLVISYAVFCSQQKPKCSAPCSTALRTARRPSPPPRLPYTTLFRSGISTRGFPGTLEPMYQELASGYRVASPASVLWSTQ